MLHNEKNKDKRVHFNNKVYVWFVYITHKHKYIGGTDKN